MGVIEKRQRNKNGKILAAILLSIIITMMIIIVVEVLDLQRDSYLVNGFGIEIFSSHIITLILHFYCHVFTFRNKKFELLLHSLA